MRSIFPLEIEEIILNFLAEDDKRCSALKACSLVCQAFLPICRKHIFGSIVINEVKLFNDHDLTSFLFRTHYAFEGLLRETPEIADYIRKLDYTINSNSDNTSIQDSLKRISRLEFLKIHPYNWPNLDWSNDPIRPALLHLLHLPTLTHFQMTGINNFVVSDLIPCVNLKYLNIRDYLHTTVTPEATFHAALPEHSIQLDEFLVGTRSSATVMRLCTARRPDGKPIIDFGSLSKVKITMEYSDECEASEELFRLCRVLTNVDITFDPQSVRPSLADMLRPSMQTLKHIVVNTRVFDEDVDPLIGITSELEVMRSKNIIESVTILVRADLDCHLEDDWGKLDEVLTAPGWLSLKRVSLAIEIACFFEGDELEVALRKLPETQFPRLSSSNSVSFGFEVKTKVHEWG